MKRGWVDLLQPEQDDRVGPGDGVEEPAVLSSVPKATDDGHLSAQDCPDPALPEGAQLGLDRLDRLACALLPGEPEETADESMQRLATDIAREGPRGGAIQRLLSREIALRRTRLRCFQGLMDIFAGRAAGDDRYVKRARLFSGIAANEQRAMVAAIELLGRLCSSTPRLSVSARNAAIWIKGDE